MSKIKFGRLRKLVKVVKAQSNAWFDLNSAYNCAGAVALMSDAMARARDKAGVEYSAYYKTDPVSELFNLGDKDRDNLFSCVGYSNLDKKKHRTKKGEIDGDSKFGKKVFKRRVKKFFATHGQVL